MRGVVDVLNQRSYQRGTNETILWEKEKSRSSVRPRRWDGEEGKGQSDLVGG